ncbi:MAG: hypothetical protein SWZ49_26195 [Cyanobacteriota bacterium]|nr:hypothetical protein [Cyanobacteriota bacterium]
MFRCRAMFDLNGNRILPLTAELQKVVLEYYKLASVKYLSDTQANRLAEILNIAQINPTVNFWITKADYFINERLNLIDKDELKNKQAKLREYLGTQPNTKHQVSIMN